jgi:N-acetylglucosamine kinase-like BadF-type ATPase
MPDHVANRVKMTTILHEHLVIGIDGGGTKTLAWLAEREPHAAAQPIGVGLAGPSNPQAVGLDLAGANILQAIRQSFAAAGCEAGPVAAVCLALAGVGREPIRRQMMTWCCHQELAGDVLVTNDAMAVLAAGTPSGWGAALIDGTGSFAFGMTADGSCQRTGGWGYLFGDEGSGYAIGLAALRAVTQAVDGRGPSTILTDRVLEHLTLQEPSDLIPTLCTPQPPRDRIAELAQVVFAAMRHGDPVASEIVDQTARDLAGLILPLTRKLDWPNGHWPLAMAGSILVRQPEIQRRLLAELEGNQCRPSHCQVVPEPVAGAIALARNACR